MFLSFWIFFLSLNALHVLRLSYRLCSPRSTRFMLFSPFPFCASQLCDPKTQCLSHHPHLFTHSPTHTDQSLFTPLSTSSGTSSSSPSTSPTPASSPRPASVSPPQFCGQPHRYVHPLHLPPHLPPSSRFVISTPLDSGGEGDGKIGIFYR